MEASTDDETDGDLSLPHSHQQWPLHVCCFTNCLLAFSQLNQSESPDLGTTPYSLHSTVLYKKLCSITASLARQIMMSFRSVSPQGRRRHFGLGPIHKGRPQNFQDFGPPPSPCPHSSACTLTPYFCGRPFLVRPPHWKRACSPTAFAVWQSAADK